MGLPKYVKLKIKKNHLISYPKSPSKVCKMQPTPPSKRKNKKEEEKKERGNLTNIIYGHPSNCPRIDISAPTKFPTSLFTSYKHDI
jgi:hypothetical protein